LAGAVDVSETLAVPLDWLDDANGYGNGQPLCPSCQAGRLHPFKVTVGLSAGGDGWSGVDYLEGWVAVCRGNGDYLRQQRQVRDSYPQDADGLAAEPGTDELEQPPCGFSMPMQPHQRRS
jgi:hypothetical protein